MKVYTKVVIDIASGRVLEESSYEHTGPVAECKGGKTETNTQDPVYNAGLLKLQQREQAIADDLHQWWKANQAPLEAAKAAANMRLLPAQEQLQSDTLAAQQGILPLEAELATTNLQNEIDLSPQKFDLAQKHLDATMNMLDVADVNVDDAMGAAQADVAAQFTQARQNLGRTASPYRTGNALGDLNAAEATAKAAALTQGRRKAEEDTVVRLRNALEQSRLTLGGGR